jgi:hypothetical protein
MTMSEEWMRKLLEEEDAGGDEPAGEALKRELERQAEERAFGDDPRSDEEIWSELEKDEQFRAYMKRGEND